LKLSIMRRRRSSERCCFCLEEIKLAPVVCTGCRSCLHLECWAECGGCPRRDCVAEAPRDGLDARHAGWGLAYQSAVAGALIGALAGAALTWWLS
jgi:hypothetical protein